VSNANLAYQFSGAVIQAIADALQASRDAELTLTNYWAALDIDTAQDVDGTLDFVGLLCGYPRPLVSSIFFETDIFEFVDALLPLETGRYDIGFADVNNPGLGGGEFDDVAPLPTNIMPAVWYRSILPLAARVRKNGLTLSVIDELGEWAVTNGGGSSYTITFTTYEDILVTFTTAIDERALTVLNMLFTAYQTSPQVTAQQP